ncbi:MAG: hypothetical protein HOO99_18425, partial [Hyphomicrobiaceae bacterium]|nr:hypothetical protein [Hyphomicrobiaceae bacterium]
MQDQATIADTMNRQGAANNQVRAAFAGGTTSGTGAVTELTAYSDKVVIDRTLISPKSDPNFGALLVDKPNASSIAREYGARDIDVAIWTAFSGSLAGGFIGTITNEVLGVTLQAIHEGTAKLNTWDIVVAQAGSNTGTLTYDPATDSAGKKTYAQDVSKGAADYKDAAHVIFGGDADKGRDSRTMDDLTGSSQADYIVGGKGNDKLQGRAGRDILIGGDGSDTASYRDAVNKIFIENAIDMSAARDAEIKAGIIRVKTDGDNTAPDANGTVDILAGIERIELTRYRDEFALTSQSPLWEYAKKLPSGLTIDGGLSDKNGAGAIQTPDPSINDATLGDKLDFSQIGLGAEGKGVILTAANDGSRGVELYSSLQTITQEYKFGLNVMIPQGTPQTQGVDTPTNLRFDGFEHVVGTGKADVLALWDLNPGKELTAEDSTTIENARRLATHVDAGNPAAVYAAQESRVSAAAVGTNLQQVIVEGGAGDDLIVGTALGCDKIYGGDGRDI